MTSTILRSISEEPLSVPESQVLQKRTPEQPRVAGEVITLPQRFARKYPTRESLARLGPFGGYIPPEEKLLREEEWTCMEQNINRLSSPKQACIMRLLLLEGKSVSEIAQGMDMKRKTVLALKKRAIINLRRLVRQWFLH